MAAQVRIAQAQVRFIQDGRELVATELGGDQISAVAVDREGVLGEARTIESLGAGNLDEISGSKHQ